MKTSRRLILAAGLVATLALAHAQAPSPHLKDKTAFVADLISRMTLDEKVGQLRLISIGP